MQTSGVISHSVLQLQSYFFEHLSFEVLNEFEAREEQVLELLNVPLPVEALDISCEFAVSRDKERQRLVRLRIELPADATRFPYSFQARIVGAFRLAEDLTEEQCAEYCEANATALLFGAVREAVVSLTGRGPMPPILLPSIFFRPLSQPAQPKAIATEDSTKAPPPKKSGTAAPRKKPK